MYAISVVVLTLVLPATFVVTGSGATMALVGTWFTFWAVGVRLTVAGAMQVARPGFTASSIFRSTDPTALPMVREIGFGNLAIGSLGLLSLALPGWTPPAAAAGAAFYALAAIGHALRSERSAKETLALATDAVVALVLGAYLAWWAAGG